LPKAALIIAAADKPMRTSCALALLLAAALSGCDSLALGYVNKLPHPITIVEHGGRESDHAIHLKAGEIFPPGFGPMAKSIDVLGGGGRLVGHYRTRELPGSGRRGRVHYLVITPRGAVVELKDHLDYND
jgi:hypothetical protein